ncbi:hypothetical protein COS31_02660 [Candidatus Roizmanbacteria bacterium CG02_land_8_20_14_3_00_36_15]|uniref:Polysaccharide biosynthesis protein C-terminal domain-containing protein n=2 Tax=Candidatus Roizmaniibacteriota TaxID=1752723 RepID=A0A2M8KKT0_9BACT|nr:MAG: hypothetical protein COS51_05310 [Candidatus Roizmanbacteria bacterium CG03_land_8_20_14_0_80_36_21]PIV37806.1 MAG: hypothetical protein COS31_02660 [Candidatus Roizmanbacteria bacterium CG02_land_8_20_14_3_00_36_15]PIY70354.1 MAG: hypothetical protein COY89_01450 [Candidatus Roizmanbacteria bacterium CG_4_10_14_0_8_um_filter_36_36]PJE60523.1 MAG: hypothetical protein COU86_03610 [Candidatus Roizmanbacteria bacterium CG10_big_fil_rev_8_21_14_0_10_36_26]
MAKRWIKSAFNNKFVKGGLFFTLANFLGGFLNYLFNSLSGKLLGPAKYSEITALFSYLTIFSLPITVITVDIIRRLGEKGKLRLSYFKMGEDWFWQRIYHWRYLLILYFLSGFFLPRITNLSLLFSFTLLVLTIFNIIGVIYSAGLQALHLFGFFSFIAIISVIIKLTGPLFVYFHVGELDTIAVFIIFSSLLGIVMSKYRIDKITKKIVAKSIVINKRLIALIFDRRIIITAISLFAINLLNNFDVIFVKKFFPADTAGIYGSWSLFAKIIFYVLSPLISLSFIFFSSKEQKKLHRKTLFMSLVILIVSGLILYGLYFYFGRFFVSLIFNKNYYSIIDLLPKAAIFGVLYSIISFLNGFFIAKNSSFSLIIAFFVFFYAVGLFFFGKTMVSVININLFFSLLSAIVYALVIFIEVSRTKNFSFFTKED